MHDLARAALLLRQGYTTDEIAGDLRASTRSVERWRRYWRAYGDCAPPRSVVQGRPRLLTQAQVDVSGVARPISEVS
jgi:transposase